MVRGAVRLVSGYDLIPIQVTVADLEGIDQMQSPILAKHLIIAERKIKMPKDRQRCENDKKTPTDKSGD